MADRHLRAVDGGREQRNEYDTDAVRHLLRAAHVLRGLAAMAMPGPWTAWPAAGGNAEVVTSATTGLTVGVAPPPIEDIGWSIAPGTADYIAALNPDSTRHIANWLEDLHHRITVDGADYTTAEYTHALVVARVLLREDPS